MNGTEFTLSPRDILSSAWKKVAGTKKTIWLAFTFICLAAYSLHFFQIMSTHFLPTLALPINVFITIINVLLQTGFLYIGIQCALDHSISYRMVFRAFQPSLAARVMGLYFLKILILLPLACVIILAINTTSVAIQSEAPIIQVLAMVILVGLAICLLAYVALRLFIGMGFIIDKKVNPWQAIKLSFQATHANIGHLIGLISLTLGILIISVLPLGIGLIWSIPLLLVTYGMIYRKLSLNLPHEPYPEEAAVFYFLNHL